MGAAVEDLLVCHAVCVLRTHFSPESYCHYSVFSDSISVFQHAFVLAVLRRHHASSQEMYSMVSSEVTFCIAANLLECADF